MEAGEVIRAGWTLWSFAYSPSTGDWLGELSGAHGPVYALCSHSPSARDPDQHRGTLLATHYRDIGNREWVAMPDPGLMKVTNPFKRRGLALGFKVRDVHLLTNEVPPFNIEWFAKRDRQWRSDTLPTRGEFLIRRGGRAQLRRVSAVLELESPYLVELKRDPRVTYAA